METPLAFNDRTKMLLGEQAVIELMKKKILIFGLGGVGGHAVEALARTGIGTLGIVDYDRVEVTNINRQIIALNSTLGCYKTHVMEKRIKDINPQANVLAYTLKLNSDNIDQLPLGDWDYIVDAIDDVAAKIILIEKAKRLGVPIISSMGAGNRVDPTKLQVSDIYKTHTCPLAKVIRKRLRELGIPELKVVFSDEKPERKEYPEDGSRPPASIAFVPAAAGLIIAAEVIKDLIKIFK
ncbi:MAG: tRNA threonylcarbamoyladenosine dehydratase [Clostridiales bacterium]|nr:tRNA threonylcarbamoyladenosine dehydratase [Clostridiales bacterium]